MRRMAIAAAVAAAVLAGCKQPTGPQTTEIIAPERPADQLAPVPGGSADTGTAVADRPVTPETVPPTPPARTHTVVQGETLWSIAARAYGDGKKWKLIAEANGITDPSKVPVGKVLTIP